MSETVITHVTQFYQAFPHVSTASDKRCLGWEGLGTRIISFHTDDYLRSLYCSVREKNSTIAIPQQKNISVGAQEQNISLVGKIQLLW